MANNTYYSVIVSWSEDDNCYIVSVPDLPGCMAHGKTKEQAIKEIETAKQLWIETALEDGDAIPKPLFARMTN